MKDLQDYFETLTLNEAIELSNTLQSENIEIKQGLELLKTVQSIYKAEMDINFPAGEELLVKLMEKFKTNLSIWINIKKGYMKIVKGRMMLKDSECQFKMTEEGIKHVESI